MSDLIKMDESQGIKETPQKTPEILNNDVSGKYGSKKSSILGLNIFHIILLFRQYRLAIAVNFVILAVVFFMFLLFSFYFSRFTFNISRFTWSFKFLYILIDSGSVFLKI
mgnify:CR=1 FL=1